MSAVRCRHALLASSCYCMVPPAVPSREPAPAPPCRSPRPRPTPSVTWRAGVLQPAPRGPEGQHHHPPLSTRHRHPPALRSTSRTDTDILPSIRIPPLATTSSHPRDDHHDPHHLRSKPLRPAPTRPFALFTSHASRPAVRATAGGCLPGVPASRPPAAQLGRLVWGPVGLVSSGQRGCGCRGATSPCALWSGLAGACLSADGWLPYTGGEASLHRWSIGSRSAPASRRRWQSHAYATRGLPTLWLSPTATHDSTLRRQQTPYG